MKFHTPWYSAVPIIGWAHRRNTENETAFLLLKLLHQIQNIDLYTVRLFLMDSAAEI